MKLRLRHVRARLTFWYVVVLAGTLLLFIAGTSALLVRNLRRELDRLLAEEVETVEARLEMGPEGRMHIRALPGEPREEVLPNMVEVLSPEGRVLYGDQALGAKFQPEEGQEDSSARSSVLPNGTRVRIISRLSRIGTQDVLIRVGASEEPLWREFRQVLSVMLLGLPLSLAAAGFGGYGLARRALAPIESMAKRAQVIHAERLDERLPIQNADDELGHLATVFNATLERLQRSFEQLRRFTADASHELRTPLTAIRSVGEVALQREASPGEYRDAIGSMLEEAGRLTRLVENLLLIARADAGQIRLERAHVRLLDVAREAAGLLEVLADEKEQRMSVTGDSGVTAYADRVLLRQAVVNLIDNAIKYSPPGGEVNVTVRVAGDAAIEVADNGPGIAPEHREKVFERFYRVDGARSRASGGAGLGLSIAQWAAAANGGRLELDGSGRGCVFRIHLPRSQPSQARG